MPPTMITKHGLAYSMDSSNIIRRRCHEQFCIPLLFPNKYVRINIERIKKRIVCMSVIETERSFFISSKRQKSSGVTHDDLFSLRQTNRLFFLFTSPCGPEPLTMTHCPLTLIIIFLRVSDADFFFWHYTIIQIVKEKKKVGVAIGEHAFDGLILVLVSKPSLKPFELKPFSFKPAAIPTKETQHSNNEDINPIM